MRLRVPARAARMDLSAHPRRSAKQKSPPQGHHSQARVEASKPEKPKWAASAVIRLCALMPHTGCRKIAAAFERKYRHTGETVSKSYVANLAKKRALAILNLRKKLKNRATKRGPTNVTWNGDSTFLNKDTQVFGVLDHGSRAALVLRRMRTPTTIDLLRVLLDAFERYGTPKFLRTDNEAVFASPLFTLVLALAGVRHQRTDRFCPWRNGRIERFFWTLKERLSPWWKEAGVPDDPQSDLDTHRFWYNHVRPHQGLAGLSPAEAWRDKPSPTPYRFFSAWNGLLTGYGRPT